jgi:hypothetical protein
VKGNEYRRILRTPPYKHAVHGASLAPLHFFGYLIKERKKRRGGRGRKRGRMKWTSLSSLPDYLQPLVMNMLLATLKWRCKLQDYKARDGQSLLEPFGLIHFTPHESQILVEDMDENFSRDMERKDMSPLPSVLSLLSWIIIIIIITFLKRKEHVKVLFL